MLKKIKIKNFSSIGDEQELSLEITAKDILDASAYEVQKGMGLNLVACLIGPNASGKTNVLKAISFIFWFIDRSYLNLRNENEIPISLHKLHEKNPIKIEIDFLNKDIWYNYVIKFNKKEILEESLKKKIKRFTPVFNLKRTSKDFNIDVHKELKINPTDFERFKQRRNIPFLASLIDTGYLPDINFFKKFSTNVSQLGLVNNHHILDLIKVSRELHNNHLLCEKILESMKQIDLGISGFQLSENHFVIEKNSTKEEKVSMPQCQHTATKGEFSLPLIDESNGTQKYIANLLAILPILEKGGVAIFDEIESGLHPSVAKKIIALFENPETNPHHAQLIFSTHQHPLINDRTKTQIFIAEKNKMLSETELYRLDAVEGVRNDENYYHHYLAGAYGGIPDITD